MVTQQYFIDNWRGRTLGDPDCTKCYGYGYWQERYKIDGDPYWHLRRVYCECYKPPNDTDNAVSIRNSADASATDDGLR